MSDNRSQTVPEALGLNLKWADKNIDTLKEFYDEEHGTISELIVKLGLVTKEDSFGKLSEGAGNLSEYELKLLYSGFQVARFLAKEKRDSLASLMGTPQSHPFLDMLKGLSGSGIQSGAIRVKMGEDGQIEEIKGGDDTPGPIKDIIKDIIKGIKERESGNSDENKDNE